MQESEISNSIHPSTLVSLDRYVISCVKGVRYRYVRNNREVYICERCALGVSSDRETAHGFMDGCWLPGPCKWCRGPVIRRRPLSSCRLCFLSYQYLMNDLGFHGITSDRITRVSYDVDSHELVELAIKDAPI
jgi:hypothetical protein